MSPTDTPFDAAVREHDARIAASGLVPWAGSEPTYTDRWSQSPEWVTAALGESKLGRARELVAALHGQRPGGVLLRCAGRRYPGEDAPRWSFVLYARRDGRPLWLGPADPLVGPVAPLSSTAFETFTAALAEAGGAFDPPPPPPEVCDEAGCRCARLELPPQATVEAFVALLSCVQQAAQRARLPGLVLGGAVPPVDAGVELTTVAPDPAVIEVSTAPSPDALDFLARRRAIDTAAAAVGLAPYRLYFNGTVADSGGGGQITLGGATPETSPFVADPRLLPSLVRCAQRHPALSYLWAHDFVGPGGQSVRADERGHGPFDELALALARLARAPADTPALLWQTLAPFLGDAAGNLHRAELNIEKLWHSTLAGRGRQGLLEFRALRMQHGAERATALACLLRALVAHLASSPDETPPVDWGRALHERFALPFYLEQDLHALLAELERAGFGLGPPLVARLLADEFRQLATVALPGGARLELRRAIEFWPLVGDAASAEQGGPSRLVDASTARLELRLCAGAAGWRLGTAGVALPLADERDADGPLRVGGLRYRAFVPQWGLHPTLPSQAPLHLDLKHPDHGDWRLTWHEWRPDGCAYPGLPGDLDDAARRRAERAVLAPRDAGSARREAIDAGDVTPPPQAVAGCTLDLRWLA